MASTTGLVEHATTWARDRFGVRLALLPSSDFRFRRTANRFGLLHYKVMIRDGY